MENKGKFMAIAITLAAGTFLGGLLAGYGLLGTSNGNPGIQNYTLRLSGSTTVFPIATHAATVFMDMYSNYDVQVAAGGSTVGITDVGTGTVDIGMSSREVKASELVTYPNLNVTAISKDGVAIVVNTALSGVVNITIENIKKIYNGTITNWATLGGPSHAINIYNRESGSGTRSTFEDLVMKYGTSTITYVGGIIEVSGSALMNSSIAGDQYGIGYIGVGFLGPSIKALNVAANPSSANVSCTVANIKALSYPLSRMLYMITNGSMSMQELAFINFMTGPIGQQIVAEEGFVPLV
nr:phosphate ABC transporter substrate-binding protein [Candidatus Sigynarchaeota archaeon]